MGDSNSDTNFYLRNVRYDEQESALLLDGVYSGNLEKSNFDPNVDKGYKAIAYLGDRFNYDKFTFSLQFNAKNFSQDRTTGAGNAPDTILVGGILYRWFGIRWNSGFLELTLNNQKLRVPIRQFSLKTNYWHTVICSVNVSEKKILTVLDEYAIYETALPESFGLEVANFHPDKEDRYLIFTNYSNGGTFDGLVRRLGVFRKFLSREEIESLRKFYLKEVH